MHPKEFKREKNATGKLTHASLTNSEVLWDLDFTHHPRVNQLINDPANYCVLLYPGEAKNLSAGEFLPQDLKHKQLVVFLLDGTWACAKKMLKLSSNLQKLERLMFTPTQKSLYYIKQQPHEWCLSTIETAHQFLQVLEQQGFESSQDWSTLLTTFLKMQEFSVACSQDPTRPGYRKGAYKNPEDRAPLRQQRSRKLFFG
jgi:DTW domain-containing protein YfiP